MSSTEDTLLKPPYLSKLNNTDCKSRTNTEIFQSIEDTNEGSFEITFEGSIARCKFTSLDYPCDFGKVNINLIYQDGVLTIVEFPSSDEADCRCMTDATFTIMNAPEKDFILKIYHGNTVGQYNEGSPIYNGIVHVDRGSITIPYHI